jgi:hypothetical protein
MYWYMSGAKLLTIVLSSFHLIVFSPRSNEKRKFSSLYIHKFVQLFIQIRHHKKGYITAINTTDQTEALVHQSGPGLLSHI